MLKGVYIRYLPAVTSTINTASSQRYIKILREDSAISIIINNFHFYFESIKKRDKSGLANGNDIRLVKIGPIALFINYILTTSVGKQLEI